MPVSNFSEYARRVAAAARRADADPTEAQREALNHKVGKVYVHGLEISITNPKGSIRRGKSSGGKEWERVMAHHYGHICRTESEDGEQFDVFIGENPESQLAFTFDFLTSDYEHDETKAVIGVRNLNEAKTVIRKNYPDGWLDDRIGEIRGYFMADFKKWLRKSGMWKKKAVEDLRKRIVIENPKGSTKDFGPDYPIPTMTYPTDYGSLPGYQGEDEDDLDFFTGTGAGHGRFRVNRPDVAGGVETKYWTGLSPEEKAAVITAFKPVVNGEPEDLDDESLLREIEKHRVKAAAPRPYRDRVDTYALKDGKVYGGIYGHGGFGVFGGGVDPGEDPAQAAVREFTEESGHTLTNPRLLPVEPHTLDWKEPYPSAKIAERAKTHRGSRTFYVVGDMGGPHGKKLVEPVAIKDVRHYDIDDAIARLHPPGLPEDMVEANHRRAEALRHIKADLAGSRPGDKQAKERPHTVAVDLDGTILTPSTPPDFGRLRPKAKAVIQGFKDKGYRVIIFTVRGDSDAVGRKLVELGVPYDYINENPDQPKDGSGKVIADVYIDDRAVSADKSWTRIEEEVESRREKASSDDRTLDRVQEAADLMSGIQVWYNPGPPAKCFIDVMDWGSPKAGELIGKELARVVGKENVEFGNENNPEGEGWVKASFELSVAQV